ncbi:F-box protein At1g30790-like [Silene latifolia]|uniref:F-box protein At1g30790-like n=1 Tax=Silene latifolia TaxID=37657 RepID=UPI003D77C75F
MVKITDEEGNDVPHIPTAILAREILRWLPVKTLFRFRCVSKYILDYISSEEFRQSHFSAALSSPRRLLLIQDNSFVSSHVLSHGIVLDRLYSSPYSSWSSVGSVNGIICLTRYNRFVIFNPAHPHDTRACRVMLNELDTSDDCSMASFGFCPASNDYVILYVASDAPRDAFQFSVNNRSWSRLSNDLREAFKFFYTPGYYFEGSFIDR